MLSTQMHVIGQKRPDLLYLLEWQKVFCTVYET